MTFLKPFMPIQRNIARLASKLYADESERAAFIAALEDPRTDADRAVVWLDDPPDDRPFTPLPPVEWQPAFVDRVPSSARPGQHTLHEEGAYYVMDLSSVFTAAVLTAAAPGGVVTDLCAAPGGKSILAHKLVRPELLLCNEVIRKRTGSLISNLTRCRVPRALVVSHDVEHLAAAIPESAALVIVDAPCSGQSLVSRGGRPQAGCFHPVTIGKNERRQRRILANAAKLVARGGMLAYMTCTFAIEENESNFEWLCDEFGFEDVTVAPLNRYRSLHSERACYRLAPQDGAGRGGFTALARRSSGGDARPFQAGDLSVIWNSAQKM